MMVSNPQQIELFFLSERYITGRLPPAILYSSWQMSTVNKKAKLFDEDDEQDTTKDSRGFSKEIQINKEYATNYQLRKEKEELHRARERGDDESEDDASTSSSEDEDGDLLSASMDVNIFKTINAIRQKDPTIYDPSQRFFENDNEDEDADSGEDEVVPMKKPGTKKRYKDVIREQILEQMEEGDEADAGADEEEGNFATKESSSRFAYNQEQQKIRRDFLQSTNEASKDGEDSPSDDDDSDILVVKRKGDASPDDEDAQRELEKEFRKLDRNSDKTSTLVDPKGEIQDGEKFLLGFFKNRAWVDKDDNGDSDDGGDQEDESNADDDSIDELDQADDFEAQYNFRFEQAAATTAVSGADLSNRSYARGNDSSLQLNTLRRKDETRREKRLARQEKKAAERRAKEEELRRLKNAKQQEIKEKLKQIKQVLGGNTDIGGDEVDEAQLMKLLEGDFDADKFEELMKETYGDEFYEKRDSQWQSDQDVRASLAKDEDGAMLVGQDDIDGGLYDGPEEEEEEPYNEMTEEDDDDEAVPEEDIEDEFDYQGQQEETGLERKIRCKMMDDLYKLDYEDIIAGQATRFKYKAVEANDYGLSTEDILLARDSTLKQFVSLKKMAPYREDGEHIVGSKKRRRVKELIQMDLEDEMKQHDIKLEEEQADGTEKEGLESKKRRRKRSKGTKKQVAGVERDCVETKNKGQYEKLKDTETDTQSEEAKTSKPKKRRRRKKNTTNDSTDKIDEPESSSRKFPENVNPSTLVKGTKKGMDGTEKQQRKKKKKPKPIGDVSGSRLASYGI